MVELRFGIFQLREDARLVGVEGVAQRGERLADAVGVFEDPQLLFQLRLLPLAEVGGRQFVGAVAEPLLVAAPPLGLLAQGVELPFELLHLGILRGILLQQGAVPRHGVERRGAELLRRKDQVLVLRVDVEQPRPEFAQLRQLHRHVVDECPALARGGDYARQGGLRGKVEVVLLEEVLQAAACEVEEPFDRAVVRGVLPGRSVVAGPEQQPQGAEQDRLPGARLSGDDIQPGVELHFELVDQHVVFNRQTA